MGIASTGFNVKKEDFIDKSQNGFTSKYGKTALQKAHPNWSVKFMFKHRNNGKLVFKSATRTQNHKKIQIIDHQERDHWQISITMSLVDFNKIMLIWMVMAGNQIQF